MKISILILLAVLVILQLNASILASPPKGGIGDGNIYSVTQRGTKPKSTTTYYAKPLHPPVKKPAGPPKGKPKVYKVVIHDLPAQNIHPPKQEKIFKIIHLGKRDGRSGGRGGSKSVKILKIMHVKQPKWSK